MSESIDIGDVAHAAGVAVGSNNQAVNVTIGTLPEPPGNLKDTIKSMWLILMEDQNERRKRQSETDDHRRWVGQQLTLIWVWVVTLTIAFALELVLLTLLVFDRLK